MSVPPTLNCVAKLQSAFTEKDEPLGPFSVGPILRVTKPPLVPVNMVVGEYVITTLRPWQSLISKIAGVWVGAIGSRTTSPVELRYPCQSIETVPPPLLRLARHKVPK